jgi:hypothetical protein
MGKKSIQQSDSQQRLHRFEESKLDLARLHAREGGSLRGVFQDVCKIAAHAFEIARVGIWLYADDRRKIQCYQLYEPRRNNVYEGTLLHQADFPDYFKALETARVIPVVDALGDRISQQFHDAYF